MSDGDAYQVIVSGGSGLIGSALIDSLAADGYAVTQLVRGNPRRTATTSQRPADGHDRREPASPVSDAAPSNRYDMQGDVPGTVRGAVRRVFWQPEEALDPDLIAHARAVICLNGAPISRLPWSDAYRAVLHDSRIPAARTWATALATALSSASDANDPPLLICASACGYYGSQPGAVIDESGRAGRTFLAHLCQDWERAACGAEATVPTALLRTASVLHPRALLRPLITLTRYGMAGRIGPGTQIWPWISLEDEIRAIRHIMDRRLTGPVNLVAPCRSSQLDIMRTLARRMHRPCLLPAPAWTARLLIGADATESLITADSYVVPQRLLDSGFAFTHTTLDDALADAMSGTADHAAASGLMRPASSSARTAS